MVVEKNELQSVLRTEYEGWTLVAVPVTARARLSFAMSVMSMVQEGGVQAKCRLTALHVALFSKSGLARPLAESSADSKRKRAMLCRSLEDVSLLLIEGRMSWSCSQLQRSGMRFKYFLPISFGVDHLVHTDD